MFHFNNRDFRDQQEFVRGGYRCGTAPPSDLQVERVFAEINAFRSTTARIAGANIPVRFIHITDGAAGKITEQQRLDQIQVLNNAYDPRGITFQYDASTVVEEDRADWFRMGHRSAAERQAKTALRVDPLRHLNFYTAGLQGGLLGWATFPFDLAGDRDMDGVVMLHSSLPGGSAAPYNLGKTAVHEVGHWLGLYHTFEPRGTCDLLDDHVLDTPPHADPDYGKPAAGAAGCNAGQTSPVHNYMNYVDDEWMTEFTPGQSERVLDQIGMYRAELAAATTTPPTPPAPTPPVISATELTLQATASGTLTGDGAEKLYSIPLPARKATIKIDGPGGVDFDLYVKRGAPPTKDEYDERAYTSGADETIEIAPDQPGDYFIMARSYRGSGDYTLDVEVD